MAAQALALAAAAKIEAQHHVASALQSARKLGMTRSAAGSAEAMQVDNGWPRPVRFRLMQDTDQRQSRGGKSHFTFHHVSLKTGELLNQWNVSRGQVS